MPEQSVVYFWRRLVALVVDLFLISLLASLIYWPVMIQSRGDLRAGVMPFERIVTTSLDALDPRYAPYMPHMEGFESYQYIREYYAWFIIPNGRDVILGNRKDEEQNFSLILPIDVNGDVTQARSYDSQILVVLWLLFTPILRARRPTSLGKTLLGLRLNSPKTLDYLGYFKREILRSWWFVMPLLLLSLRDFDFSKTAHLKIIEQKQYLENYAATGKAPAPIRVSESEVLLAFVNFSLVAGFLLLILYRVRRNSPKMPWDLFVGTDVSRYR